MVVSAELIRRRFGAPARLLVAGCGDGREAADLADLLSASVVGVDIADRFDPGARERVELRRADVAELPFEDDRFDLVFSFHMLEHVGDVQRAVSEMARVLRPGGGLWIGTPNRERLLGYLGSRDASLRQKVRWNVNDWRARLRGEFENELGGHAGFSREELVAVLRPCFGVPQDETVAYYSGLYSRLRNVFPALDRSGMGRFVFPALYYAARLPEPDR